MVSGMKSNSTPGGGGYNEMSMNDTKGIIIHGQYDMNTMSTTRPPSTMTPRG
jgi:type VI secretion system secreted protein VgrG